MYWRKALPLLFLIAITGPGFAQSHFTRVPDGNIEALRAALVDAHSRPAVRNVILLGGTFRFGPDDNLPEVQTLVYLYADRKPAHFIGIDGGPATLIRVASQGSLEITNVEFSGFHAGPGGGSGDRGVLLNDGTLILRKVQILDDSGTSGCGQNSCSDDNPLVLNRAAGNFIASQVSVIDGGGEGNASPGADGTVLTNLGTARLQNLQLYFTRPGFATPFLNSGQMWLTNATLKSENTGNPFDAEWIISPGRLQVANSIISGFASAWCDTVISAGFNLVDNTACGIASREDLVGVPTGLRWRPVQANWLHRDEQILTHALVPIAASPAVDSANDAWCPPVSLEVEQTHNTTRTLDGDNDGTVRCDRGAYEIPRAFIDTGGINGLYFNPDADGHYIYIADTRYNTLVMWTTFDASGKQAWIYGIADKAVAGRSLIADAYINRDGRVSLAGQFDPATSEHWGHLEVDLTDCDEGDFLFSSDLPGFGSGEFQIQRLAYVKRLGCVDSAAED